MESGMGEEGRGKKEQKIRRIVTFIAIISWMISMAFVGFFMPSFIDSSPIFKVRNINIEGLNSIPEAEVREVVKVVGSNWLLVSEEQLFKFLNRKMGNSVKEVNIVRKFSLSGVDLEVLVKERIPVATVNVEGGVYFADMNGVLFMNEYIKEPVYPVVYTEKFNSSDFVNLYRYIIEKIDFKIKEIYISNDRIILYVSDKPNLKIILPPVEFLDDKVSERFKFIYNLKEGEVDLRYSKFILVN